MHAKRTAGWIVLFVLLLGSWPATAAPTPPAASSTPAVAAPAPDVTAPTAAGQIDSLEDVLDLPFIRHGHTTLYDETNLRMIVFGGWNGRSYFNDLWALDPTMGAEAWTKIDIDGIVPPARGQHTAVLDLWNERMIVFGGRGRLQLWNDVWALDLTAGAESWTELTPSGTPPSPRRAHTAIFDYFNQRMIVFGGADESGVQDDAWVLDLATPGAESWSELDLGISIPSPRAQHTAVYDQNNQRMIVFGGFTAGTLLNDAWELDLTPGSEVWAQMGPAGTFPAIRQGHSAIIDHNSHMLVFGGLGTTEFYDDLWRLTLTPGSEEWIQLTPNGTLPNGRAWHAVGRQVVPYRMVVLGGRGMGQGGGTQWVLDLGGMQWSPLAPTLPSWWGGGGQAQGGVIEAGGKPQVTLSIEDARPDTVVNLLRGTEVWFVVRIATTSNAYSQDVDVTLTVNTAKFEVLKAGTRHYDADDVGGWTTPQSQGDGRYRLPNVDLYKYSGDTDYSTQVIFRANVKTSASEGYTNLRANARGTNWQARLNDTADARIYRDPQAWIITNRRRLYVEFINDDVSNLLAAVFEQAQGSGYNDNPSAVVLYADRYHPSLRDWDNTDVDYTSPSTANLMSNTLDDWLDSQGVYPDYLLIVGDDNILPLRRKKDYNLVCGDGPCTENEHPDCWGEEAVCDELVANDYFMTDNPYGDVAGGSDWKEGDLEIAVGRIVGIDPRDMQYFLDVSVNGPSWQLHRAILASGGDDHSDLWLQGDDNDAHDILKYGLGYSMDESLIDTGPTKTQVVNAMEIGFTVMVAAGHGETDSWSAPGGGGSEWPEGNMWSFELSSYDPSVLIPARHPFFYFQACRVGFAYTDGWDSWGPPYYDDTMVYSLVHRGASAIVASAGLSYGDFDRNEATSGELMSNEFWVVADAYPDRSDPLGWSLMATKDQFVISSDFSRKTVQSFTFYGVPWMRLDGAGKAVKNAALPIPTDTTSTAVWATPRQGIDATYVITTQIDASTYAISTTSAGWNLIEVQGLRQHIASGDVKLPEARLRLLLPLSATVTSLAFTPTDAITLTGLDIPTFYASAPISGGQRGGYTTTLDGLYPVTATWQPRMLDTHQLVHVRVSPVTYDATADEAILYQTVDVAITYDSPQAVALTFYDTNQVHYLPGEPITTTARIVNTGDVSETVTATLVLQNAEGRVVGLRGSGPLQIPAGGYHDLLLGWSGNLPEDAYLARLLLWQAGQVVAGAGQEVYVKSAEIANVGTPDIAMVGQPYTFTVTFDHLAPDMTVAVASLSIYDSRGRLAGYLLPQTVIVPGAMTQTVGFSWTPPRSGRYVASAVVTAGGQEYGPFSRVFTVEYQAFLPIVLRNSQ